MGQIVRLRPSGKRLFKSWDHLEPLSPRAKLEVILEKIGLDLPRGRDPIQMVDQSGLYYYRARYYDPVLKRFISEDPIGMEAGPNLYLYVQGNPVLLADPFGLDLTITFYPGGVGHLGVGINSANTVGLYPIEQNLTALATGTTVAGVVASDAVFQKSNAIANSSTITIRTETTAVSR